MRYALLASCFLDDDAATAGLELAAVMPPAAALVGHAATGLAALSTPVWAAAVLALAGLPVSLPEALAAVAFVATAVALGCAAVVAGFEGSLLSLADLLGTTLSGAAELDVAEAFRAAAPVPAAAPALTEAFCPAAAADALVGRLVLG